MADEYIGKTLAEKYRIDSLISIETIGNLYHGTHLFMDKPVCVKILPSTLAIDGAIVDQFAKEARTVSRISHPNILSVTDYGSANGTVFIIFEDSHGKTLKDLIFETGKFPLDRAKKIVKEVAAVVAVAHSNGISHLNLSSENILVRQNTYFEDEVKVLNFGTQAFDINDLDYPVEKAHYLSPEQCLNTLETDSRSDVYSLGIIFFEMLTGTVPFSAQSTTDLMLKHTHDPAPPIHAFRDDLPVQLDDVMIAALAKNPAVRYQSVEEFTEALDKISPNRADLADETTVNNGIDSQIIDDAEKSRNNLWKTAFITLAGICLLGGFFVYMTASKKTDPTTTAQTDANGSPVQPLNPATGAFEQGLANMESYNPSLYGSNSNSNGLPEVGGVTDPYWSSGKVPPGAPQGGAYGSLPNSGSIPYQVQPGAGGQQVYIDPTTGSVFMPTGDGKFSQMVPANTANTNTQPVKPPKNANVNTTVPTTPPSNTLVKTPAANTAPADVAGEPKPTPTAKTKPTPAVPKVPTEKTIPAADTPKPPASMDKRAPSGKTQDTK